MSRSSSPGEAARLIKKPSTDVPSSKLMGAFPPSFRPYLELMRIDKPTGTQLMFFPYAWGLTMAAYRIKMPVQEYWPELFKYLFGAFILRSATCTINDILDRDLDASVERTSHRALPSGRISVFKAYLFLFVQYAIGAYFLYSTRKGLAFWVALVQLIPLPAIYPVLKRITYWPQAYLGFFLSLGFLISWDSTTGSVDKGLVFTVMAGKCCWTLVYDTIYACQDREDDAKAGILSTAVLFGLWVLPIVKTFTVAFVAMLGIAGYLNRQGPVYFAVSVGGAIAMWVWRFSTLDVDVDEHCWRDFNRNPKLGWVIWAGLVADYLSKMEFVRLSSM